MSEPRRRRYLVRDVDQVRALSGPLPHQLVASLERLGPSSVKELAAHLELEPESLYYHVRKLHSVGLLQIREERATARRPEAIYELTGRELIFDSRGASPKFREALARHQRSLMMMAVRLFERAIRRRGERTRSRSSAPCIIQQHARLSPSRQAELRRLLEEVADFMAENDDPALSPFFSLTISLSPVLRDHDV